MCIIVNSSEESGGKQLENTQMTIQHSVRYRAAVWSFVGQILHNPIEDLGSIED
ncbi:MAG: hypothetical protein ACXVMI_10385 [Flavisolibacter sp.]